MFKRVRWLSGLLVVLTMTSPAVAQSPAVRQRSNGSWQAEYWNNTTLSGLPVLTRSEASIDYDWGTSSPGPGVSADSFSVRWTRYIQFTGGPYRFTATSDDGMRAWVDGELIINMWYDHSPITVSTDKNLTAGHHQVIVEYYENTVAAIARFSWAPVSTPIAGWRGEYFNNPTLSGAPILTRDDAQINFNWGTGSPAPGINADRFSARWTCNLNLTAGMYRFTMTVDDGGRLWVNNYLLIDTWRDQPPTTYIGDIYLPGGSIPIKVEYYENSGGAVAMLSWSPTGTPSPPPPGAIIVDDIDPGFVRGGSPTGWRTVAEGYNGRLVWTRNNDRIRPAYNWARWYPTLAPGRYEVFVFIPERYSTTSQARYWISHANGFTLRIVNQSTNGNCWVSLGTYYFRGTSMDYVSLADVTYEPRVSRLIAFDAVKWEPR